MNDIYRFNNKYLKCIVTKYSSAFNDAGYLANSGALIVYHPENESETYRSKNIDGTESENTYNRNYIYLGNEFLASGYGFLCKDMRVKAEGIVEEYDDTITTLKKADETEKTNRELEDKKLLNKFDEYVTIDGGDITKTKININGSIIDTKNILLYREEAKYENLEITNIDVKINGVDVKGNDINLPLGSRVKTIDVTIEYNMNDSGGIEKIEVIHKNLNYEGQTIQDTTLNIESVIINYDLDDSSRADEGIIHYKKIFDNDTLLYVTDIISDIISGFYIYVKKTPVSKYKNYPMLEDNFGIKLKSIGNIIQDNKIEVLKDINIIPTYSLLYKLMHNYYDAISIYDFNNKNTLTLNTTPNAKATISIDNATSENYKVLYVALPIQYKINNVYGVNSNYECYNWTGAVLKNSQSYNLLTYNNNDNVYYTTKYNIYKISDYNSSDNTKGGFICNQIIIDVSLKNENLSYEVTREETFNNAPLVFDESSKNIKSEYFNSLYWIDLKNDNETNINDKLSAAIYNCTE